MNRTGFLRLSLLLAVVLTGCTSGRQGIWPTYPTAVTAEDRERIHAEFGITCRPWRQTGWDGWEIVSGHWQIRTTVRDEYLLTYLPLLLEDAFVAYQKQLSTQRKPLRPLRGYLFSDKREWMTFTRSYAPEISSVTDHITAGGYQYKGTYVSFYIGRKGTLANATHEGLHLFWAETFGTPIPSWLNEGLAVQFEGHQRVDGRLVVDLSENRNRQINLRYAIVHKRLIPLEELIGLHPGDVIAGSQNNWQAYYGQVWALYRFMRDGRGGRYRPALRRIIEDCKRGRYPVDVGMGGRAERRQAAAVERFSAYLPVAFEQFKREYVRFARQLAGFATED